jgi:integrase
MSRKVTPKLSIATEEWTAVAVRRSTSNTIHYDYRSLLRRFTKRVGDLNMSSVKPEHVEDFFYGPGKTALVASCGLATQAKHRTTLKRFFDWCHRKGYCALDGEAMMSDIRKGGGNNKRNRYRMTRGQIRALMEAASNPRDRALTAFVANTGVRISEALAMTVRDVSFPKGELYVKLIKTNEEETLPLSLDLEEELRAYMTFYAESVGPLKRHFFLFPAYHKNRFLNGGTVAPRNLNPTARITTSQRIIKGMAQRAGIELEPGDAWHTIRRSFARIVFDDASEAGHDTALRIAQAALNHASVKTTERYLGLEVERERYSAMMKGRRFLTADIDPGKIVTLEERRVSRG